MCALVTVVQTCALPIWTSTPASHLCRSTLKASPNSAFSLPAWKVRRSSTPKAISPASATCCRRVFSAPLLCRRRRDGRCRRHLPRTARRAQGPPSQARRKLPRLPESLAEAPADDSAARAALQGLRLSRSAFAGARKSVVEGKDGVGRLEL